MLLLALVLLLLSAAGALVAAVRVVAVALPGRPQPGAKYLARRAAWLTASVAVVAYSLGFVHVSWSEHDFGNGADSTPAPACRDGFEPAVREDLSHHESSYLPLRFDCVREDGTSYPSEPGLVWINWATLILALTTALLAVVVGYAAERRAREAVLRQ
ncbi:hypothetical protein [Streptomyces hainanensis]|uniref:DUF3592 domain-containing protein n=1 Tax=Streptomyces hainanensis TaxID=402648 RepID=A0A4R4TD36_9ACTN|nr:hypothetical protein [Streptomyces hainanensis]TDC75227.1 hypothetical protein E1283_13155 [Streptomyces hainanensis]